MDSISPKSFLTNIPLFDGIAEASVSRLTAIKPVEFGAGRTVFAQGNRSSTMYVILSGAVDISSHAPASNSESLAARGPGEVIGELSLLDGQPHSADVVAISPTLVLPISAKELEALVASDPRFAMNLLRALASKLRLAAARL